MKLLFARSLVNGDVSLGRLSTAVLTHSLNKKVVRRRSMTETWTAVLSAMLSAQDRAS